MARDSYASPVAFFGALRHKAQLLARTEGGTVSDYLTSYYFSRLVARIFHTQPDRWLVKGGHALLMRYAQAARLSQDIDIQRSAPGDLADAVADLMQAAAHDLGDHFVFAPTRTSLHEGEGGAKQTFRVHLGTQEIGVLKVDVVTGGRPLITEPEVRRIAPLIDLAWPADWPQARLYPLVNHLADKVCALYERHNNVPSSRYRDLADILLISQREKVDGRWAQLALRTEAHRRRRAGHPGVELRLPPRFEVPGPVWPDRFLAAARQVPGLHQVATWEQAAAAAETFLGPLLADEVPGDWDPALAAWQTRLSAPDPALSPQQAALLAAIRDRAAGATPPPRSPQPPAPAQQPPLPPLSPGSGNRPVP